MFKYEPRSLATLDPALAQHHANAYSTYLVRLMISPSKRAAFPSTISPQWLLSSSPKQVADIGIPAAIWSHCGSRPYFTKLPLVPLTRNRS